METEQIAHFKQKADVWQITQQNNKQKLTSAKMLISTWNLISGKQRISTAFATFQNLWFLLSPECTCATCIASKQTEICLALLAQDVCFVCSHLLQQAQKVNRHALTMTKKSNVKDWSQANNKKLAELFRKGRTHGGIDCKQTDKDCITEVFALSRKNRWQLQLCSSFQKKCARGNLAKSLDHARVANAEKKVEQFQSVLCDVPTVCLHWPLFSF